MFAISRAKTKLDFEEELVLYRAKFSFPAFMNRKTTVRTIPPLPLLRVTMGQTATIYSAQHILYVKWFPEGKTIKVNPCPVVW